MNPGDRRSDWHDKTTHPANRNRPNPSTSGKVRPPVLEELGFYALAGQPASSRAIIEEIHDGEAIGLGAAFISERYDRKEAVTLCGAAGAASERIGIQTAATNHNTRHPMVTAGFARTMQSLTGGRFVLGFGRGVPLAQDAYGIPRITTAQLEDFAGLMRRLFRGEAIIGHNGPAGSWPVLFLDDRLHEYLPMGIVAFGPETLKLGGRCFDEVVLHTYFTDETTARCVRTVKEAAAKAGRDPASVKVWSCFATIGDHIPEERRLMKTVGRLATYLQAYGDLLVRTNRWDPGVLIRFLADPVVQGSRGLDVVGTTEQLEHVATLIPDDWLAHAASGSPERCVAAIGKQFDLGCDGVIMHGATPDELGPIVAAYRASGERSRPRRAEPTGGN
jgi:probable F420-dependent oxidoreductase